MKYSLIIFCMLLFFPLYSYSYNADFTNFENAVYSQTYETSAILILYNKARECVKEFAKEEQQLSYLAACQELLGRHYLFIKDKNNAAIAFETGIEYANQSIKIIPDARAYAIYAQNITQNMRTKSLNYIITNGPKIEKMVKKALELSPSDVLPQYLTITRYVFAPSAFNNPKKGLELIQSVLANENMVLSEAMKFNMYEAGAKANLLLKNNTEAERYLALAKTIFPKNENIEILEKQFL
ncbi:MAG: hypothetical protein ACRC5H_04720 [Treponemataceae bacterium]